ncbi:hypothetical protein NEMBOFW57_004285 [Staphylotrichum longicolle]|uniref:Uncharacterized protein n=1 Tax=Staphylotrichum longicolle TaxID=669026 RepID=A0AAD4F7S5_9PEZI|nr:hypothetical protein NEMBOFW57_004285 [Staphylotrichum longicolle]
MDKSLSIVPITVQTLQAEMAKKSADQHDYAGFFKATMLNVSEVYFKKPSREFLDAVDVWAWDLGGQRFMYTPNQPDVQDDSEEYCFKRWKELKGEQTLEDLKHKSRDRTHQTIMHNVHISWKALDKMEQDALCYSTLRICMLPPSRGGFGSEKRWKDITPTNAMPPLDGRSLSKSSSGARQVFMVDANRLHQEFEEKVSASLRTNPHKPFGGFKQNGTPTPKTKGDGVSKAKEAGPGNVPHFTDDHEATDLHEPDEPQGISTMPPTNVTRKQRRSRTLFVVH